MPANTVAYALNFNPFDFPSPDGQELQQIILADDHTGGILARMETHLFSIEQFLIQIILDPMTVVEEFLLVGICQIHIIDESECTNGTGMDTEASHHPLFRGKRELSFMQLMFKSVSDGAKFRVFVLSLLLSSVSILFLLSNHPKHFLSAFSTFMSASYKERLIV